MMRIVLMAAALAACAPAQQVKQEEAAMASPSSRLPAPTPADVPVRIDASKNGQRVEVAVGQRFAVELVGVPTAGYVWAVKQTPAFVSPAGEASGNTTREQSQPGFTGGNHWEVFVFTANAAGTGELALEQRRPWETSEPPSDLFRVIIVAR
jgi:inhibitor of cysteine peptidase